MNLPVEWRARPGDQADRCSRPATQAHVEMGERLRIGSEVCLERFQFRQFTGLEQVGKPCGQRGLAAAIVGQSQQPDHAPAGFALIEGIEQRIEGAAVGVAREQLIAVDDMQQGHRLAAQGMDEMVIVDHVATAPVAMGATTAQGQQWRGADEQLQPIIVEVDAQGVADQP